MPDFSRAKLFANKHVTQNASFNLFGAIRQAQCLRGSGNASDIEYIWFARRSSAICLSIRSIAKDRVPSVILRCRYPNTGDLQADHAEHSATTRDSLQEN
jgi:hypothetical protein